ncbi:MAG TPA: protein kinase [Isosphaeraceae bacterium]|jgi:tRNA A-37 threonylcarbamoyl transferase component Bud32
MSDIDAESLAQHATLLGLVTKPAAQEAKAEADDGSADSLIKSFLRKELLTRWQVDKLLKNDPSGFFYGGCAVLFHIAEGTFARVYRGKKLPGGQPVAIKVLRNRFVSDPEAVERFNKEAEAGLRLIHPNIVRMYEYGAEGDKHFMTMEYVEGSNLRDFLKLRSRLGETEALPLMLGLASAMAYANAQGITHRDVKGTNILIASNGTAKLVDFGLATIEDEKKMAAAHGQRTVDYSALERTCGSPKGDPRSDIFFLGCVFYQMLTGQLPLPEVETNDPLAKMLRRGINSIRPLHEHPHAPKTELTHIIEKMMKVDLKARYQTFEEVQRDLDAYLTTVASPTPRAGKPETSPDEEGPEAPRPAPRPRREGQKTILCVEAQEEIQQAFRKQLSKMGYRILLVSNAEVAAERYREDPPDLVVFDIDGLGPDSLGSFLDMHDAALADGHELAALVLLGPRQHYLAKNLPAADRLVVLPKPIKMKQVQDAISGLIPLPSA